RGVPRWPGPSPIPLSAHQIPCVSPAQPSGQPRRMPRMLNSTSISRPRSCLRATSSARISCDPIDLARTGRNQPISDSKEKNPALTGCVETRGFGDPGPLFLWGSGEAGAKTPGANQIDCSQDVVGEYAERKRPTSERDHLLPASPARPCRISRPKGRGVSSGAGAPTAEPAASRGGRACLERAANPLHRAGVDPEPLRELAHAGAPGFG